MLKNRRRNKLVILFALYFIIGIILRIYYLDQFSKSPLFNIPLGPDVQEYSSWANEIIAGQLLWAKVHIHSPLYPYFLAAICMILFHIQNSYFWIRLFQLTIGLFAVIPLFLSLKIVYKKSDPKESSFNKITIISFLILYLLYPPLIYYLGELTSEVLLIPLLSMSLFCLYKWEEKKEEISNEETDKETNSSDIRNMCWLGAAGLFAGLAVVTHPLSLFFIIFETFYLLIKIILKKYRPVLKKHILNFFIFTIFATIPVIPIIIYNTCILKENIPFQANSGFNLYLGNGPDADGTCRLRPGPEWDKVHAEAKKIASEKKISEDKYFIESTVNHILKYPVKWLKLLGRKALYFWNHNEITAGADLMTIRYFTNFQRNTTWSFGLCAVLAILAIILNIGPDFYGESHNKFFVRYRHFLLLILGFWVANTLLVTSGRYRVGMLPSMLILSAVGVSSIFSLIFYFRKRSILIIPGIAIAMAIVYLPSPPYNKAKEAGEAASIYGEALLRDGRYNEAEKYLLTAIEAQPDWNRNYTLLGDVCEKQYKFDAAEFLYKKSIKMNPKDPEGYVNLATLYSSRRRKKLAEEYFNKAIKLKIDTPKLQYNYALYCYENGNEKKAIKHYLECLKFDPANHRSLNNLGIIYFQDENYKEAASYFEKALRIQPRNAERILNLSLAYLLSGNTEKAQKTLNRASTIDSNITKIQTIQSLIDGRLKSEK